MFIKNSQQDIEFNIPHTLSNVGIKISGGADSGILCYILAKYKAEERPDITIHPITVINIDKPYQLLVSRRVINFCENEFNIKFEEHYPCDSGFENHMATPQKKVLDEMYRLKVIDCHAMGVTANPEKNDSTLHLFNGNGVTRDYDRDRTNELKETFWVQKNGPQKSFRPFANIDKKGIAELYHHFNLMDTLFPLTKSCEGFTPNWDSPHCGKCWWCMERMWGFNRLV